MRWSGESCWIPLGGLDLGLPFENHTSFPAPGEVLLYPGGFSETEILFPYGGVRFASIVGQLAGNHFLTIEEGRENLRELGVSTLYEGAQGHHVRAIVNEYCRTRRRGLCSSICPGGHTPPGETQGGFF